MIGVRSMEVIMFVLAKSEIIGDRVYWEGQINWKVRKSGHINALVVRKG